MAETCPVTGGDEQLSRLLRHALAAGASDLHLAPGYPPLARIHGVLTPFQADDGPKLRALTPAETSALASACITAQGRSLNAARLLDQHTDLDGSLSLEHADQTARFRFNLHRVQDRWGLALRVISAQVPTLAQLAFPDALAQRLVSHPHGLVVFTGHAGVGKSSSMAAIIQLLADSRPVHVLTVEEPIEFVFKPTGRSLFTQREVGNDVESFAAGLKHGLRQDPDVILVGETRDPDTAQMVLSAAETGHLVFTTLHTRDAKGALTRFVDLFPSQAQDDVRRQLAMSLRAVISQLLLPAVGRESRVLALEVLHVNQQAEIAIRNGRIETLESVVQTGRRDGMFSLDDDLQRLLKAGLISLETARRVAKWPEKLANPGVPGRAHL